MTTVAEQTEKDKQAAKDARDEAMAAKEKELNASKSGKGTRTFLGLTRGKNPQEIKYENWDTDQGDTLPTSLSEFMDVLKVRGITDKDMESEVVRRLIVGDNELLYKEASDPIAEFVESSWSEDIQKGFRLVVRNFAVNNNVSVEEAANLIKPAYLASQAKKSA